MSGTLFSEATFANHLDAYPDAHLALRRYKTSAWQRFQTLPWPDRKAENWRFSDLTQLTQLDTFQLVAPPDTTQSTSLINRSDWLQETAGRIVFADNQCVEAPSLKNKWQRSGVVWLPLTTAFKQHPEWLETYFLKEQRTSPGSEKLQALHTAYCQSGYVLYIPRDVKITAPFVSYYWAYTLHCTLFPHTLIIVEPGANVNVVDFYLSSHEDRAAFSCGRHQLYAGAGAQVSHSTVQLFNEQTFSFQTEATVADRDSNVARFGIHLGGKRARSEQQLRLIDSNAAVKVYGLTVARGEQVYDQRTLQLHAAPHTTSDLLYKNALLDRSHTIFSGMIHVEETAQQTDAYQTNRNLLLSPSAETNSLPGLEIRAHDVKCSHGATTGQLDQKLLFYMRSRGLPKKVAQELLVFGFFEEVLEKITHKALADCLRERIQAKLQGQPLLPPPPEQPPLPDLRFDSHRILKDDCEATLIPDGIAFVLSKGTPVDITHRLGGNFTVICEKGMFRISSEHAAALGETVTQPLPEKQPSDSFEPPNKTILWDQLRTVYDPEIPVNIVDLGLIYSLELKPIDAKNYHVDAALTLTAPGCGMGPVIAEDVKQRLLAVRGVSEAHVEIVWDPPWNQEMISEEGKMELGLI